jgi:hypothetical protein
MLAARFVILRFAIVLLAGAALLIGGLIFVLGPSATGDAFTTALQVVAPDVAPLTGLRGPDIDSEMRFYAVLFIAYGGAGFWALRAFQERLGLVRLMLAIFMLGGLGRAVSYVSVGAPHPLFILLMWIELLAPPILLALSLKPKSER